MKKTKEELNYLLRQIERNLAKAMILADEEKKLDDIKHRLELLKKSTVNLMFELEKITTNGN